MKTLFHKFKSIILMDFEYSQLNGDLPSPICLVFKDLVTREVKKIWYDNLTVHAPPFNNYKDTLFVSYYSLAEYACFNVLKWPLPMHTLDLFTEFRNITNGLPNTQSSLLDAMAYFNLSSINYEEKNEMRELAIRGSPFTDQEKEDLIEYCLSDVLALEALLQKIIPDLDLDRALLRGRYMAALSKVEEIGIPLDIALYEKLKAHWLDIQLRLIEDINLSFDVFEGTTFKASKFEAYLVRSKLPWPRLPSGKPKLDSDTFKEMSLLYPELRPLHQVREMLSKLKLNELAVGHDSRNRTMLSPFRSKTGRNQPSNSKNIFGLPSWIRNLVLAPPSKSLAYIDWSQQEFAIAAALSGDSLMKEAYISSDPYLTFAKQAGRVPPSGTKATHSRERELFKTCSLGVLFGMGVDALALKTGEPRHVAVELLRLHKETYRDFWKWSDDIVEQAMLKNKLSTVFGWNVSITHNSKSQSLRNFPMQANGAEMLRIAVILMYERGISICMTIHDAILIEANSLEISEKVKIAQECMEEASKIVLNGFKLKSEAQIFNHPTPYHDEKGKEMWAKVSALLKELERPCNTL